MIKNNRRTLAEKIVASRSTPSREEMARAITILAPILDRDGQVPIGRHEVQLNRMMKLFPLKTFAGMMGCTAILSILCALFFRGGILLRLLGIAVVTADGNRVTRRQMLSRACTAWAPVLVGLVACILLKPLIGLPASVSLVGLIVAGATIWSLVLPERSLQDRIVGTWLVPR